MRFVERLFIDFRSESQINFTGQPRKIPEIGNHERLQRGERHDSIHGGWSSQSWFEPIPVIVQVKTNCWHSTQSNFDCRWRSDNQTFFSLIGEYCTERILKSYGFIVLENARNFSTDHRSITSASYACARNPLLPGDGKTGKSVPSRSR